MSSREIGVAKATELLVGSISLTEREIAWVRVAANLSGNSLRAQVAAMVKGHLLKFTPKYYRDVAYLARKYGRTWEEVFAYLVESPPPIGDTVVQEYPILSHEEATEVPNSGLPDTQALLNEIAALARLLGESLVSRETVSDDLEQDGAGADQNLGDRANEEVDTEKP